MKLDPDLTPTLLPDGMLQYKYDDGTTIVMPIAEGRPEGSELIIDECPLCREQHRHAPNEGTRVAHCRKGPGGEYYLRPKGSTGPFLPVGWTPEDLAEALAEAQAN